MQSTPARTARLTDSAAREWQATRLPKSWAVSTPAVSSSSLMRDDLGARIGDELVARDVELDVVDALAAADAHRAADLVDAVGDHAETLGMHVRLRSSPRPPVTVISGPAAR